MKYGPTQTGRFLPATLSAAVAANELHAIENRIAQMVDRTGPNDLTGEQLERFSDRIRHMAWARQRGGR